MFSFLKQKSTSKDSTAMPTEIDAEIETETETKTQPAPDRIAQGLNIDDDANMNPMYENERQKQRGTSNLNFVNDISRDSMLGEDDTYSVSMVERRRSSATNAISVPPDNTTQGAPAQSTTIVAVSKKRCSDAGSGRVRRPPRRTSVFMRNFALKPPNTNDAWDPLLFIMVWMTQMLLPLGLVVKLGSVFLKKLLRRKKRHKATPSLSSQDSAARGETASGDENTAQRKQHITLRKQRKRRRNALLAFDLLMYALLAFNCYLYEARIAGRQNGFEGAVVVHYFFRVSRVEVLLPVAFYTIAAALHACTRALVQRRDEDHSTLFYSFDESLWQTLWHSPPADAKEQDIVRADVAQGWADLPSHARRGLPMEKMWMYGTYTPDANKRAKKSAEFLSTEKDAFTVFELACQVWSLAAGRKRWAKFRVVPLALAALVGFLSPFLRVAGALRIDAKNLFAGPSRDDAAATEPTNSQLLPPKPLSVQVVVTLLSVVLSTCFALLIIRVVHKAMMDACRRWKALRSISAIFDGGRDATWHSLPSLSIIGASRPHRGYKASASGAAAHQGIDHNNDAGADDAHEGEDRSFDNLMGWITVRAIMLRCDQRLSADNQRRISFILLANLVGCAVAIYNLLLSESGVAWSHLNVHILAASAILSGYFFRILGFIADSNAQQRAHSECLLRAKAAVVHRRWELKDPNTPCDIDQTCRSWHQPYAVWNGSANVYVRQYLAKLDELERVLDVVRAEMSASDRFSTMYGMAVDEAYRVKVLLLLGAGVFAQSIEYLVS